MLVCIFFVDRLLVCTRHQGFANLCVFVNAKVVAWSWRDRTSGIRKLALKPRVSITRTVVKAIQLSVRDDTCEPEYKTSMILCLSIGRFSPASRPLLACFSPRVSPPKGERKPKPVSVMETETCFRFQTLQLRKQIRYRRFPFLSFNLWRIIPHLRVFGYQP